jgi:hypothetical protein
MPDDEKTVLLMRTAMDKEPPETKPEDGLSRRRFVKQVAAWGAAALALYAPPQLRALALAADNPGAGRTRKSPGRDKLLLLDKDPAADKDPNVDKDPNEKQPGEKDPIEKTPGEKDPNEKLPGEKDPNENTEDYTNADSEQPGQPRRYAGPGPDEWGPDA